jgi:hypothetical protein
MIRSPALSLSQPRGERKPNLPSVGNCFIENSANQVDGASAMKEAANRGGLFDALALQLLV